MPPYMLWEKRAGQTPLQALGEIRAVYPHLASVPLSYAGRLDPMASGTLLILVGDACKNREDYLKLDKEYEFEVLLGFESDTGDILGVAQYGGYTVSHTTDAYQDAGLSLLGTHDFPYPAFSSKPVRGKPLFQYALEGSLDSLSIPTSPMTVREITYIEAKTIPCENMIDEVLKKIADFNPPLDPDRLGSDFRKEEIITRWNELRNQTAHTSCTILKYRARVSSGTYIRSLSTHIAQSLGTSGLAYAIHRTRIFL